MGNLRDETLSALANANKTPDDVLWVGSPNVWTTWEDFSAYANFTYDEGYGSVEIPMDLVIVCKDGWLERAEYDGSEWWEYKQMPKKPQKQKSLSAEMWRFFGD